MNGWQDEASAAEPKELDPAAFCEEPVRDPLGEQGFSDRYPPPPPSPPPPSLFAGEKLLGLIDGAVELALGVPCRLPPELRKYVGEVLEAIGPPPVLPARAPSPASRWKWLLGVTGAYFGLAFLQGVRVRRQLALLQRAEQQAPTSAAPDNVGEEVGDAADRQPGGGLGVDGGGDPSAGTPDS